MGEGGSRFLNAHKSTVQAGESLFEFLQPAGPGPVQDFADRWGSGLYGVCFATADLTAMRRHLDSQKVAFAEEGGALCLALAETHGMPTTLVEDTQRQPVGAIPLRV